MYIFIECMRTELKTVYIGHLVALSSRQTALTIFLLQEEKMYYYIKAYKSDIILF